ncbi:MAG: Fe-S-containing hydro-lyase [Desulfovibrio sp.]|nr:Fe-S-containing hydro-lyase [Desulfovibrio sp.]
MSEIKYIQAPFDETTARSLRAGDSVRISGVILAARDAAHKRLCECLDRGEPLPCDLTGHVVYYVGPSPAKPGQAIGSAGPTTSGRMDAYTPRLLAQGLRGMIGKGYRKPEVVEAMKKYGVPYMAAVGGAGALISRCIKKYSVLAWPELGPEALALMEVEQFPAIVVIDCLGNNQYEAGQAPYKKI